MKSRNEVLASACAAVLLFAMIGACDSGDSTPDLPEGWAGAQRISDFMQLECSASAIDGPGESVRARAVSSGIALDYANAPFRCAQDVEGFLRRNDSALEILVQPVDMDPESVAKCDCLYEIKMSLPVAAGSYELSVYRRWDNINDPNDPLEVGQVAVDVP